MIVVTGQTEYFPGIGKIGFEGRASGRQELYESLINQYI